MNTLDLSTLINFRKELHQHPELSGFEVETAKRVKHFIQDHYPTEIIENLVSTGLAAIYRFPKKGVSVTIRCELDALPIHEINGFTHSSNKDGISHKCGHDGHMAIVSGLLFWLKEQAFSSGEVILLFQPAEENGEGAHSVMNDQRFKDLRTDYFFALHNIPKEPLHSIIFIKSGFSAEVQSFVIRVLGKESHAAEPENGINPALALSKIIVALSTMEHVNPKDDQFNVMTPVHIHMGKKAYGISPADGELHYTLRTWNEHQMSFLKAKISEVVADICELYQLKFDIEWLEYFPASLNHKECHNYIVSAAKEHEYKLIEKSHPFKFGEDFGWYSKGYKKAMFGIGAGVDSPALHNNNYDFPDEIIETGIHMFSSIITQILQDSL